jgi:hypothetical protein
MLAGRTRRLRVKWGRIGWERMRFDANLDRPGAIGAPDTIRTCGLYLRRVALYPAELRVPNRETTRRAYADQRWGSRPVGCNVVATREPQHDPKLIRTPNQLKTYSNSSHTRSPTCNVVAFGGQRSIQLSYGRFARFLSSSGRARQRRRPVRRGPRGMKQEGPRV